MLEQERSGSTSQKSPPSNSRREHSSGAHRIDLNIALGDLSVYAELLVASMYLVVLRHRRLRTALKERAELPAAFSRSSSTRTMTHTKQGFFSLQTAADLREKARHDLSLLEESPTDAYLAFNFFVTARHILEWEFGARVAAALIEGSPILRICRHVADGAKHLNLTSKVHKQVLGLTSRGAFDASAFDSGSFDVNYLEVELSQDEARAAGVPESVEVAALARAVMSELGRAF